LTGFSILTYFAAQYCVNYLMTKLYKSNNTAESIVGWLSVICCIGMIAGMFCSRVLLSSSMLVLFICSLLPSKMATNWQTWRSNKFAIFSFLFFLAYLISGFWSEDKDFWLASATNKLPFAVLPFAFLAAPLHKEKYQRAIILGIILLQLVVVGNSMLQLALHTDFYLQGYHLSHPLPTTKYGDHIRFSLTLVMTILFSFYLLFEKHRNPLSVWFKVLLWINILISILFIHILAAKTGIMCLYIMASIYAMAKLWRRNKVVALTVVAAIIALPLIAYRTIPTFKTKIDYVFYEIAKSKQDQRYDYTLSDAGRMITYDIGGKAILNHPWVGVGAGDVMIEMKKGYAKDYPEVAANQHYGPINQFMFTALSIGLPLTLLLVGLTISSFMGKIRWRLYLVLTSLVMLASIMVESMLELQFGVFTYLFFILFWMSALRQTPATKIDASIT